MEADENDQRDEATTNRTWAPSAEITTMTLVSAGEAN